ncbi:MAG: hypothetical protein OZ948_15510 [Deltaproteobacteria bacterium]|nr:hypothetical protein [Deltaproteobacteria bacterium]
MKKAQRGRSKSRRKRKQGKSKPRDRWVYARTDGVVSEIEVRVDPLTGDIAFVTPVKNMYSEVSYERPKGPKVVARTPLPGPSLQASPDRAMRVNYDAFLAVDTNTRVIQDQKLSVTGIVLGSRTIDPANGAPAVAYRVPYCLEFVDVAEDPERVGWVMALRQLRDDGLLPTGRVAMIVDSSLSALSGINAREEPIASGFYLPEGITMAYASSDVGGGGVASKLIRSADQAADRVLAYFAAGRAPLNRDYFSGFPFKAFRIIPDRRAAAASGLSFLWPYFSCRWARLPP